ncbi:MAG: class I SAM-dependent methyltransferase [Proteobacteria bacterium]|nr:class I SAM-dependent methyltransferase [Pseudomonadota bacterium]
MASDLHDKPMATVHEELTGGLGRAVYFRAKRMLVRSFLNQQDAKVVIADHHEYPLHDVSMNGLSFFVPTSEQRWEPGAVLDFAVVVQDRSAFHADDKLASAAFREAVFRGRGRIARADETPVATHIGVQLLDGFLNLPQLQWNFAERMLRRDLDGGPAAIRDRVPPAYREIVEHLAFFLQFYKQSLNRHEERYAEMGDEGQDAIRHRAPQAALESLRAPWYALRERAAQAILPYVDTPAAFRAAKRYTETVLTPLMLECPFVHRAYTKPLGYAGDYETMLQIYRNTFEGASVFARVFHKLGCEEILAAGVRTRKVFIEQAHEAEYTRFVNSSPAGTPFRVTSLGAGPAREVAAFLDQRATWPRPVHWTLIDQEEEALSLAYHDLFPRTANTNPSRTMRCMYMSFMQFLADPSSTLSDEPQDFIYSVGLFDYIQEKRGRMIVRALYDRLAPGGFLAIANALRPNTHFWYAELLLDWTLLYRTRDDMLALAGDLPPDVERQVAVEPSNAFYFLVVRKP